jgi:hypothetical protein
MNTSVDALQGNLDPDGDTDVEDPADPLSAAVGNPAKTIALWRTYLPEDCVATMIKMGWHRST